MEDEGKMFRRMAEEEIWEISEGKWNIESIHDELDWLQTKIDSLLAMKIIDATKLIGMKAIIKELQQVVNKMWKIDIRLHSAKRNLTIYNEHLEGVAKEMFPKTIKTDQQVGDSDETQPAKQ